MSDLEERAKRLFGTLPNFVEWDTAYLLSDGSWLKRGRGKTIAHHSMAEEILGHPCAGHCIVDFVNKTGAIRIAQSMRRGRSGIDVLYSGRVPTSEQIEKLHELCGSSGQPLDNWGRCFGHVHCGKMRSSESYTGRPYEPGEREGKSFHFDGGLKEIVYAMEKCHV